MFSCPPSINKNKDLENWNSNIWRLWCREQVKIFLDRANLFEHQTLVCNSGTTSTIFETTLSTTAMTSSSVLSTSPSNTTTTGRKTPAKAHTPTTSASSTTATTTSSTTTTSLTSVSSTKSTSTVLPINAIAGPTSEISIEDEIFTLVQDSQTAAEIEEKINIWKKTE